MMAYVMVNDIVAKLGFDKVDKKRGGTSQTSLYKLVRRTLEIL